MRISDWSSDVCSSDLQRGHAAIPFSNDPEFQVGCDLVGRKQAILPRCQCGIVQFTIAFTEITPIATKVATQVHTGVELALLDQFVNASRTNQLARSEEHTSELQSLMRISYAVFCLQKKT